MNLESLEDIRKEARELYNGGNLSELEEIFEKNEGFAEKLESLSLKFHSRFVEHEKSHEGPQKELIENNLGNVMFEADVEEITSFKKLCDIMAASYREKKTVKAVGGFNSFSRVHDTNGFLLLTEKFSGIVKTNTKLLKSNVNQQAIKDDIVYYDMKCGTTIHEIIKVLKKDDRALPNLGGYDGQTIVGLNATSTHGSGIQIPPLATSIKTVDLIVPGQLYRIEPADGITDPISFKAKYPSVTLIQDDDTFNCSVVNLGAFGVVFYVTVSTVKLYSIIDEREETTWNEAKSILKQQPYETNPYLKYRNCEVWISPYTPYTLIVKRNIATEEDKQTYPKPEIKKWFQEFIESPLISKITGRTAKSAAISIELAFPMKDDNHLNAVDALLETLKEMYDKDQLYINGPLSLRFSSSLPQFLSMANNDEGIPTCYVEMAILYYRPSQFHSQIFDSLMATALKFSGRCHWGQYLPPDLDLNYLASSYKKENVDKFIKQIERFDPQGLMRNDLLHQLGLKSTKEIPIQNKPGDIRKESKNIRNRLRSISEDSEFVDEISDLIPYLPVIANERCGTWYVNPKRLFHQSVYFKSTDGHNGKWNFNLRRLNAHLLDVIINYGGCIIVDSTRNGKRMPDSLSKTIPIWCSTINYSINKFRENLLSSTTISSNINKDKDVDNSVEFIQNRLKSLKLKQKSNDNDVINVHTEMESMDLDDDNYNDSHDISSLSESLKKPLRPIWFTPSSNLYLHELPDYRNMPFYPVICLSASKIVNNGLDFRSNGDSGNDGFAYIQGSADDHEMWSMGLTPSLFWQYKTEILNKQSSQDCELFIKQLVHQSKINKKSPLSSSPLLLAASSSSLLRKDEFNFIGNTNIAIGNRKSEPINFNFHTTSFNYLQLFIPEGKKGQHQLYQQIPNALKFLKDPIIKNNSLDKEHSKKILIYCEQGIDRSVGICLSVLIEYFDDQGDVIINGIYHKCVTKELIQRKLLYIMKYRFQANPTRSTLKKINLYFISKE
ncbi:19926_t:CDS:10 [Entrophospora sp. SA101]|nr:19926_t:CDS:10 [Entrophospora sp. SA101]